MTDKLTDLGRIMALFETQPNRPLSHEEVRAQLDLDISERTFRRRLSELVQQGRLASSGLKKSVRYHLPAKRPLRAHEPVAYNAAFLAEYQPNRTFYLPSSLRQELMSIGLRANESALAGTYARQIYQRLLIDLSYNSSRLEGNTYTHAETEKLLLEGEAASGKLDQEKIMILNHKDAINHIVDKADVIELSEYEILTIHYLLSDGLVPEHYSGKVRSEGVRIGGSGYIPLENHDKLSVLLKEVAHKAAMIDDPFEQSFFLLCHLPYLQPFIDVNKRTARLCSNIPLIKQNLVPLSFNDVDQQEYMKAMLDMYENNNIKPLMAIYEQTYHFTAKQYDATLIAMDVDEIRVRYRRFRRACLGHIISNMLVGKEMEEYLASCIREEIPLPDQDAVRSDFREDLHYLDVVRIAGLGVSVSQFEKWKALQG